MVVYTNTYLICIIMFSALSGKMKLKAQLSLYNSYPILKSTEESYSQTSFKQDPRVNIRVPSDHIQRPFRIGVCLWNIKNAVFVCGWDHC